MYGAEHVSCLGCLPAPAQSRGTACALWWLAPMGDHRAFTGLLEIMGHEETHLHPSHH